MAYLWQMFPKNNAVLEFSSAHDFILYLWHIMQLIYFYIWLPLLVYESSLRTRSMFY